MDQNNRKMLEDGICFAVLYTCFAYIIGNFGNVSPTGMIFTPAFFPFHDHLWAIFNVGGPPFGNEYWIWLRYMDDLNLAFFNGLLLFLIPWTIILVSIFWLIYSKKEILKDGSK